jgi:hypothetical protein
VRPLALLILLTLTGCTTTQPVVVGCPKPNIPPAPHYPVASLKQGDSPATVAKAYVATVRLQQDYIGELTHILRGYE